MDATIGRIVHYKLNEQDVLQIREQRELLAQMVGAALRQGESPSPGDVYPAIVVRAYGPSTNLTVFLDGMDTFWVRDRSEGESDGAWTWPEKVGAGQESSRH
jgi:hypothetical protein